MVETVKMDHRPDRPITQIMAWPQERPEPYEAHADASQIDSPDPKPCEVGDGFTNLPKKRKASQDLQRTGSKSPRFPVMASQNAEGRNGKRVSRRFVSVQSQYDTTCEIDFGGDPL